MRPDASTASKKLLSRLLADALLAARACEVLLFVVFAPASGEEAAGVGFLGAAFFADCDVFFCVDAFAMALVIAPLCRQARIYFFQKCAACNYAVTPRTCCLW